MMPMASAVTGQHIATKSVAIRNRYIRRVVMMLLFAAVVLITFVWTRIRVIQLGYEVTQLHHDVATLRGERSRLEMEVAKLKSPDRLERVAREVLHMRPALGEDIVFLGE